MPSQTVLDGVNVQSSAQQAIDGVCSIIVRGDLAGGHVTIRAADDPAAPANFQPIGPLSQLSAPGWLNCDLVGPYTLEIEYSGPSDQVETPTPDVTVVVNTPTA